MGWQQPKPFGSFIIWTKYSEQTVDLRKHPGITPRVLIMPEGLNSNGKSFSNTDDLSEKGIRLVFITVLCENVFTNLECSHET